MDLLQGLHFGAIGSENSWAAMISITALTTPASPIATMTSSRWVRSSFCAGPPGGRAG